MNPIPVRKPVTELTDRELLEEIATRLRDFDRFYAAWAVSGLRGLRAVMRNGSQP
jgi:hypothetical protein